MLKKSRKVKEQTVSKAKFVEKLSARLDIDFKVTEKVFLETLDLIVETIQEGNRLEFRNYMIFDTKIQKEREAQNPKTMEKVLIPERRVVVFKKVQRLQDLGDINGLKV